MLRVAEPLGSLLASCRHAPCLRLLAGVNSAGHLVHLQRTPLHRHSRTAPRFLSKSDTPAGQGWASAPVHAANTTLRGGGCTGSSWRALVAGGTVVAGAVGLNTQVSASEAENVGGHHDTTTMYNAATSGGGGITEEDVEGCVVRHGVLDNGGVKLHYVECGKVDGPLVLLLHGFPNFWYSWAYQLKPLADAGFHVIAPDLRGYNLSSKPPDISSYGRKELVSDVLALADSFAPGQKISIVGHDWGGMVAWCFGFEHPERVARLLNLNIPHPVTLGLALRDSWAQMKRSWYMYYFEIPWLPEWLLSRSNYKSLRGIYHGTTPLPDDFIQRHVDAMAKPGALTAALNYYRAAIRGSCWKGAQPRVDFPVKVVWGQQDVALGEGEMATPPEKLVPNAEPPVLLPGGSHWVLWDQKEAVNEEILKFLKAELSQ